MKHTKIAMYASLIAVLVLVPTRMVRAQSTSSDTVAAVTQLENDSIKADLAGDKSWSETNLANSWMGCDSNGTWYTKAEVLKMMDDTKNNKYNSENITDLKVRAYGNTAIATYTDTYDAMVQGEHRSRTILASDVWVKIGGAWKEVNSHSTPKKK